ncbi:MAG TPA: APC family permease [Terriglobales bacterium]|nr:APC family permease [Terriglobales bacterium]
MKQLAKQLGAVDYFVVGFGAMIGVGWLVVMDDWLGRGGPLGAALAFLIGAIIILPVGYVYGRLVQAMPDAGAEIAYTARAFNRKLSFATGWMMVLAYLVVCPWEGVAIGTICSYIFPQLRSIELYRIAGQAVYLPQLLLGLALTAVLTWINYAGVKMSARFQGVTTFALLGLFVVFTLGAASHGSTANLSPGFAHAPWLSVLLVLQIVPYFMTGFESVGKCAEEASPRFRPQAFLRAMLAAIVVSGAFYCIIILLVGYCFPWQKLIDQPFATAYALERVVRGQWIVNLVLAAALFALIKCFNANFLATTRLLFALGRRQMLHPGLGDIHPQTQTPWAAVLLTGALTALGVFLGKAILIPITEVGGMAAACGWLASSLALFVIETSIWPRALAVVGAVISFALVAMKLLPFVPGHFSLAEWIALGLWLVLGAAVSRGKTEMARAEPSGR